MILLATLPVLEGDNMIDSRAAEQGFVIGMMLLIVSVIVLTVLLQFDVLVFEQETGWQWYK